MTKRSRHPVTAAERRVYHEVMARDRGCVAPRLDPLCGPCGGVLTRQHVRAAVGMPRLTDMQHVLILCFRHHLETGWATAKPNLEAQRRYLGLVA